MEIENIISQINSFLMKEHWFDFELALFNDHNLTIIGSVDFTYYHNIEIKFIDVFLMYLPREWKSDTSINIFEILSGDDARQVNLKYEVERGNIIFKINTEGIELGFLVIAKSVIYNTDKVYYYKKDNLKENERIANWVK